MFKLPVSKPVSEHKPAKLNAAHILTNYVHFSKTHFTLNLMSPFLSFSTVLSKRLPTNGLYAFLIYCS